MNLNSFHSRKPTRLFFLFSLLLGLISLACNAAGLIPAIGTPAPQENISTNAPDSESTAIIPQGSKQQNHLDCQAIGDAFMDFEGSYPTLGIISNGANTGANTPGSPFYIDFTKLRSDYDVLATLPDSPTFGKTDAAITQFRQLTDLVENNLKAGATPASDGSGDAQKSIDLYAKLSQPYIVVSDAFSTACPNYSAPTVTPAP